MDQLVERVGTTAPRPRLSQVARFRVRISAWSGTFFGSILDLSASNLAMIELLELTP